MPFLFAKGLTTTFGDLPEAGEGVEASIPGCPRVPPAESLLDVLTAPPDLLVSKSAPDTADSGGDGVDPPDPELPPDLLKAPPDPPGPELPPGDDGSVCGSS